MISDLDIRVYPYILIYIFLKTCISSEHPIPDSSQKTRDSFFYYYTLFYTNLYVLKRDIKSTRLQFIKLFNGGHH